MRKKAVLIQLNAAHSAALFEDANFSAPGGEKLICNGQEYEVTEFIKERVRRYMETYIISRLVYVTEEIQGRTK